MRPFLPYTRANLDKVGRSPRVTPAKAGVPFGFFLGVDLYQSKRFLKQPFDQAVFIDMNAVRRRIARQARHRHDLAAQGDDKTRARR